MTFVDQLADLTRSDLPRVGGKGANLGEMMRAGLPVPGGFVVNVQAFRSFIEATGIAQLIGDRLRGVAADDVALKRVADSLQSAVSQGSISAPIELEIRSAYEELGRQTGESSPWVAVRSSATVEDTAEHSFAGLFRSFLNVRGADAVVAKVKECWESAFGPRVLFYRTRVGMVAGEQLIAVVVQRMVEARKSGVLFTVDPASGNRDLVVIEAAWGLGEVVVGGEVRPDRFVVSKRNLAIVERAVGRKDVELIRGENGSNRLNPIPPERAGVPCLSDEEVRALAELGRRAEAHFGAPQDMEFAINDHGLYVVQTRPVTALGRAQEESVLPLVRGLGASPGIAMGAVRVLHSPEEGDKLREGEILVAPMTAPDWVPLMRRAAAIVTDSGGLTSHAAIVSRELGIPCIVGTRQATVALSDGLLVTVDARRGLVYRGAQPQAERMRPAAEPRSVPSPATATRLYVNLGEPTRAAEVAALDVDGVGLLRAEFMILEALEGSHPRLLLERKQGARLVERLAAGLRMFASAFHPRPVIYRTMDFRSNEFRGLEGGERFEPAEQNPMIGYRGCYRYVKEPDLFRLELEAVAEVRGEFENLHLMIPFVRTERELVRCKQLVDDSRLGGGKGFELWVMAEVPSVVYWIPAYARAGISGVSIGSNDLTQLMLGVDRDSEILSPLFDERDPAVLAAIHAIIRASHQANLTCSICGQAPSSYPDYAERLVAWGIDSVSVNPDAIELSRRHIAAAEQRLLLNEARSRLNGVETPVAEAPGSRSGA